MPTKQNYTLLHVKRHLFSFVQFSDKISRLMNRRGLSARSLASALALSNGAVSAWKKGARPHAPIMLKLAEFFDVPADVLADDSRDLPRLEADTAGSVRESAEDYSANEEAFEKWLEFIRNCRVEAEKLSGGDLDRGQVIFEKLLATWLTAHPFDPNAEVAERSKMPIPKARLSGRADEETESPRRSGTG